MLTIEYDENGQLMHCRYKWNELHQDYTDFDEWILDENGEKIPASTCLCYAREPTECICGCNSWGNYRYD